MGILSYGGQFFSVVITADAWHNHKYHLSMSEIDPIDGMLKVDQDMAKILMDGFFDEWREVPNPGKMTEITHFAGN